MDFVNKNGDTVHRDGFGDILFSKSRIKNSMIGHGTGNTKIETFAAIPEVLKHGIEIDSQDNWKGRSYDTYIFAAPVNYKNEKVYVGAIVQKDSQSNRYYLHEVVTNDALLEEIKKEALTSESDRTSALTGDLDTVSDAKASIINITESTRKSNNNSEKPTELKARGRKKQNAQPPNKDNPLQGSLHNIVPRKNYGKTDAAIDSITEGNRATAENIGSIIKDIGKTFKVNIYAKRFRNRGNTLGWFNNTHNEIHTQEQDVLMKEILQQRKNLSAISRNR